MKLLLDTHIWLWSLAAPSRLKHRVSIELQDPHNELWLSPVTVWEALVLARKGRIDLGPDPVGWVRQALSKASFFEASLNVEVAIQSTTLDIQHQDPADRFLAATALVYELTFVTGDERLLGLQKVAILPNR